MKLPPEEKERLERIQKAILDSVSKERTVIKLEVNVRTLSGPTTPEFENLVFNKITAAVNRALRPLEKERRLSGTGFTRIDIPEEPYRTVVSLTPDQLEYFNGKRLPGESLDEAIDRIVAFTFKEEM